MMYELYLDKTIIEKKYTVLELLMVFQGGTHDVHGEKCYPNIPAAVTTVLTKVKKSLLR